MLTVIRCINQKLCNHRIIGRVPAGTVVEMRKAVADHEYEYQCPRCKNYYAVTTQ